MHFNQLALFTDDPVESAVSAPAEVAHEGHEGHEGHERHERKLGWHPQRTSTRAEVIAERHNAPRPKVAVALWRLLEITLLLTLMIGNDHGWAVRSAARGAL